MKVLIVLTFLLALIALGVSLYFAWKSDLHHKQLTWKHKRLADDMDNAANIVLKMALALQEQSHIDLELENFDLRGTEKIHEA